MPKKVPLQWKGNRPIPLMDTQLADFAGEEWRNMKVTGFDNAYQVSNYGRVKSLCRDISTKNGKSIRKEEQIIKLSILQHKSAIILKMELTHEEFKKKRSFSVSRMVYDLFVEPFDWESRSQFVKRIDSDTLNCHYKNLVLEQAGLSFRQPVDQYDKDGVFLQRFASMQDAADATGATISQIREASLKKGLQGKTFYWRRGAQMPCIDISGPDIRKKKAIAAKFRPVQQLDDDGALIKTYGSLLAAAAAMGKTNTSGIIKACANKRLTAYGFHWQYVDSNVSGSGAELYTRQNGVRAYKEPVHQYGINGVFIRSFPSASDAAIALNIDGGRIASAIRSKYKMVNEWYFRQGTAETFIDLSGFEEQRDQYLMAANKPVQKFSKDGKLLATYDSTTSAANDNKVRSDLITKACKNPDSKCLGFMWRYVD